MSHDNFHIGQYLRDQRGQTALVGVLIIMAIILLLALTMSYTSTKELLTSSAETANKQVTYLADSCLDEVLIRLKRDAAYVGGMLALLTGSCDVSIIVQEDRRTINITARQGSNVRKLEAVVDLEEKELRLRSWRELTN